jgi:sulfonate transport system substrate-binding protein
MRATPFCAAIAAAAFCLATGTTARAEPLTIRQGWVSLTAAFTPIIFQKKELMPHYGKSYVLEASHFGGTSAELTAIAAGEVDLVTIGFSTLAASIERAGLDLRIVADGFQDGIDDHFSSRYIVRNDSGIAKIEDLKGKVLATNGLGGSLDVALRAMLRKHGLEDRRDYQMVETAFPNMLPMLLEHKVDFITSVNPFSRDPRFQEQTRVLFTVKEAMDGPTQFIIWTARKAFLDKNHAAMVDLMEDAVRVTRFLTDPANHAAVVQIAAKITKQPPERLDYVYTKDDNYRDPMMRPNMANLQRAIDVQQQTGFLKTKLDVKQYADLDILKEAIARIK